MLISMETSNLGLSKCLLALVFAGTVTGWGLADETQRADTVRQTINTRLRLLQNLKVRRVNATLLANREQYWRRRSLEDLTCFFSTFYAVGRTY